MKHVLTLISAVAFVVLTLTLSSVWAEGGEVEVEYRTSTESVNVGDEFSVDIVVKNPDKQNIISARTWLEYNPAHLEGVAVNTTNSLFTLSAPGEDEFDAESGQVKIGRSNIGGGVSAVESTVATVTFKVKTASNVTTGIKPYDYQVTELGHTSINIIDQGFPVNVLSREPKELTLPLNAGAPVGGIGGSQPIDLIQPVVPPVGLVGLLRPADLRINAGQNYVDLKWGAVYDPSRAGFNVYYGKTSGQYSRRRVLENANVTRIEGLNNGEVYFFAVTAYDSFGRESDYSDEAGVIVGQPLSSTAPFEGLLQATIGRLPSQPENGPLAWWILISAVGLSGSILFRSQKVKSSND